MKRRMMMSKSNSSELIVLDNYEIISDNRWYINSNGEFEYGDNNSNMKAFEFDANTQTVFVQFETTKEDNTIQNYIDLLASEVIGSSTWRSSDVLHAYYSYNANGTVHNNNSNSIGISNGEIVIDNTFNYETITKLMINSNDCCMSGISLKETLSIFVANSNITNFYVDENIRKVTRQYETGSSILSKYNAYVNKLIQNKKMYFCSQEGSGRARGFITIKIINKCYSANEMKQLTSLNRV